MYCTKCGAEIRDDAAVCLHCGCEAAPQPQKPAVPGLTESSPAREENPFAIAGFVCSFLVPVAGLVLGIVGLVKFKKYNSGKEFAISGIIISSLAIAVSVAVSVMQMLAYNMVMLFMTELIKGIISGIK